MISKLGFSLLLLQSIIGFILPIIFFYYQKYSIKQTLPTDLRNNYKKELFLAIKKITLLTLIIAVLTNLCLIYSFIVSDYSVVNVYQNSHHLKPLIFKIAGSWGNHEGSMLLLITVINFYNFIFAWYSRLDNKIKITTICSQSLIIALFSSYTAFASNPFKFNFPVPNQGLGLNPILQDIGLALHPPMLYSGYIGFTIVFSITIAGLLNNNFNLKIINSLSNWLYIAYALLTIGITLGAWWAYRELGWGGYWFWDPVENISLMPWISATVLIHALKMSNQYNYLRLWSAFLSILTMILCLLGIFLTRSGILTSLHSFAIDAGRSFFIIVIISIIGGLGLLIFALKSKKFIFNKSLISNTNNNKITLISINNYLLLIALFVVLLGTLYPIFLRGLFDKFISIGPEYYNSIFSILIIPFLIFLIASNFINKKIFTIENIVILLFSIITTTLIFYYNDKQNLLKILILFLAILSAILSFYKHQKITVRMAHGGFSLLILGIAITSYFSITKEIDLKQNQKFNIAKYEIEFKEVNYLAGKNFISRQGEFLIKKNNQDLTKLTPELRYYPINDQTTNESSIYHSVYGDLYIVIGNKDDKENYAIRIYYKPLVYFIWLGAFLIAIGVLLRFYNNTKSHL